MTADATPTADALPGSVSVVMPCRNERAYVEACLAAILAQDLPEGLDFEIIVADGMSDDGTRAILDALAAREPRVRVIDNPQKIVSTGLNAAIRAAKGAIVIRMDMHATYAPDYIATCLETLERTGADDVGGPWILTGTGYVQRAIAAAFAAPFAAGGARSHDPDYEGEVDSVWCGCYRREVFDRIGFYDEELVRNQDDELNLRLTRSGGRIWQTPRIRFEYAPRSTLKGLFRQYSQYGYWKVRVIQKHRLPASIRHLVPVLFVSGLLAGPLLAWWITPLRWIWLGAVAFYLLASLAASLSTARKEPRLFPVLPVVFLTFHLAYGWGFLQGLRDFVLLKRGAQADMVTLSR